MKIAVLVSGGVDSSVALKLLKEAGHELTAFYLKIWLEDELSFLGDCPWEEDLKYVRAICERENIPLEIIPLQKEYHETVVAYTLAEVKAGRTPNPDIMCNNNIKFGLFFEKIDLNKYDKVATGHYAQIIEENGRFLLKQAPDAVKDQTYFLSGLKQEQLAKLIFPIGHLNKEEVRALADKFDLPNKNRKDSQGICFLGKFHYDEFIKHYLGTKHGKIVEYESGRELGEHEGYWYYTIGQRKGIKLSGGPWFVVAKDPATNTVYISNNYHSPEKSRNKLSITNLNWLTAGPPSKRNLQVKLRHGENSYNCQVDPQGDKVNLTLDRDDQGIAQGQFAVLYDNEICIGSGVIC